MIIQNLVTFAERFALPIVVLVTIVVTHILRTTRSMNVKKIRTILCGHGIASLLAILTSLINTYYADSIIIPLVMFISLIIITKVQADQGYIENMEDASGVLLYLSSVLTPTVIIFVALILILYYYKFYFPDDNRACQIIVQALNIGEALLLTIINIIIPTTSIVGCLWAIISCFIVFSLFLPDLNPKAASIILTHFPNAMVSVLNKEWI